MLSGSLKSRLGFRPLAGMSIITSDTFASRIFPGFRPLAGMSIISYSGSNNVCNKSFRPLAGMSIIAHAHFSSDSFQCFRPLAGMSIIIKQVLEQNNEDMFPSPRGDEYNPQNKLKISAIFC